MYKTEREIMSQYEALGKTYRYIMDRRDELKAFLDKQPYKSVTFIGCGSSYCLCKSAEISFKLRTGMAANSIPAGDLMMNFPHYERLMKDTLLVIPSRSGSTTEVIRAVEKVRDKYRAPCISISAASGSRLGRIADISLELPWAFDESVCQTRTVTNLYFANLLLIAILLEDSLLIDELDRVVQNGNAYMERVQGEIQEIAKRAGWEKVVVLADSELAGIAEEGALAFNEICQLPANHYHVLDVRHGPMVLIDDKSLVIMACSPWGESYQKDLIRHLKSKGGFVITVSSREENVWGSDCNISVPPYQNYGVYGVPFILVPQLLSYYKAIELGVNPDAPHGLDPWIQL
ncbi:MAG: SIS domain-containing protein [Clostridia bacterium]